jgi:3-oxoacyl-[acyl-carrier protein] reductase
MRIGAAGSMQVDFTGRVVVITGAARGIGAGLVTAFAHAGAAVLAVDRAAGKAEATAEQAGFGQVVSRTVDVTRWAEVTDAAGEAVARWGRLDAWVNCAGVFPQARLEELTAENLAETFTINVHAAFAGARAAADHLSAGGSVINVSSIAAVRPRPGRLAYGASKAAVEHATRGLAAELAPAGIRVNAIAPGYIDTAMLDWARREGVLDALATNEVWLRRIGEVADIANATLFLASDAASYITGVVLPVDGGLRAAGGGASSS